MNADERRYYKTSTRIEHESLIQAMTAVQSSFAGVLLNKNSDVGDAIGALWRTEQSV
jgi:hypothetical protein